ncbi:MAG TPA: RNA polymerase sigma factor [Polyangiaceae bacterium]|jgi:RNA polymerase sigma-70 factor (ECF subfamily)|nr:RNA polymerase sigma factor [Polyangiaceae bacterium]
MTSLQDTAQHQSRLGEPDAEMTASSLDSAMSRYADGDDAAFSEIFTALAPRLQAFLRRLCSSPDLAQDLVQETFLRMHRARGSFAAGGAVIPWAYAIARNCFVSHARSPKAKAARSSLDIADHETAAGLDCSAEHTVAARQSALLVEQTLARMSVVNREAFVLLRFEGQSVAAAAQILGTSEGAVKLRAFRAYEQLRAALKSAEEGSESSRS